MVIIHNGVFNDNDDGFYTKIFKKFVDFELSNFQKWSVKHIIEGDNVLITAHTGSGKTLPAEFMIKYFTEYAEERGEKRKKIIYASPIKALSNQKLYDFRNKFPNISFGLLTGDCKDNPDADVLIMTTEILRNTLFNKKNNQLNNSKIPLSFDMDVKNDLAGVIFDEVHYINDKDRGSIWEQSIILLPPTVQLLMLSATIDKPEEFAKWIETEKSIQSKRENTKEKKMILAPTYHRVVPLTHYLWLNTLSSAFKKTKDVKIMNLLNNYTNKPIVVKNPQGVFNHDNYNNIERLKGYLHDVNCRPKRKYILNNLVLYLKNNNMLPAITFIFSRKNVEIAASEIQHNLLDNQNISTMIEQECRNIIVKKIPNYKEYLELPEYKNVVALLKKGIAIHHAGVITIIREMIELLFEKGYIKLLFATETFAVGINMPTKTVVFNGLTKYDGSFMRYLLPHEYTQMAGRAGRRGIDTVGHVIHCNNLFNIETAKEYENIICGKPQVLSSKFNISFNIVLNTLSGDCGSDEIDKEEKHNSIISFINQSLLFKDIDKQTENYEKEILVMRENTDKMNDNFIKSCKTPIDVINEYIKLQKSISMANSKRKKTINKQMKKITKTHKSLKKDIEIYNNIQNKYKSIERLIKNKNNIQNFIPEQIDTVVNILYDEGFIVNDESGNKVMTNLGRAATQLQEVHPMVLSYILVKTNYFERLTPTQIVTVLSIFTNIRVQDEVKSYSPNYYDVTINKIIEETSTQLQKIKDIEVNYGLSQKDCNDIQFDIINYISRWCDSEDEITCKDIIKNMKDEKNIFIGDFVKAILKINNISQELEKIAEMENNISFLEKLSTIPNITLKYIATNQSLYI